MSDIVTLNGYKIKDEKAVRTYESIADMKADTKLKEGYHVKTKGYYEANDGGHGEYVIVDDDTLVDDGGSIHVLSNGLRANLIINDGVDVKKFGAYGDGVHDDTTRIQTAINLGKPLIFDKSTYMINTTGLQLIDNSTLKFNHTTLKMVTNSSTGYRILNISNCNNVNILGNVYLIGDRETHTGDTGEYGHCIQIIGASNVVIENADCSYGWGDGVYLGRTDTTNIIPENITINNLKCHHNSRNGLSITSGKNVIINNLITHHNTRTSPRGGFDIEPNDSNDVIDVTLNNVYTYDNGQSTTFYQAFISNAYTDNYIVNIGNLNIKGQLSITVNNDKSIINIDNINIETIDTQTTACVLTCHGKLNIKNYYIKLVSTITGFIYTEYLNGFINNLLVQNNATSMNFINNSNNVLLTIDNLNFNGNYANESNTNKTDIRINNIIKRIQEINDSENRHIKPFSTNINVSNDITSISYNDIMTYDNYTFYVTNSNAATNCSVALNTKKFLYNGDLSTSISLPYGNVMKARFDKSSGFYIVEYLRSLT